MNLSSKTRIAVLRGGPSESYDTSLKTGGYVLSILRDMPETYEPLDIFISKDGEWHRDGLVEEPHRLLRHVDVAFNGLHGAYGEDGQVQKILESLKVPFTGSRAVPSAFSMDKDRTKKIYKSLSIPTTMHEVILPHDDMDAKLIFIFRNFLHPVVVRTANKSGGLFKRIAHSFRDLRDAVTEAFMHSHKVMVEEFIKGDEISSTVIEGAKGEKLYALLPYGHDNLGVLGKDIEEMSKRAHEALGLRHYSSSDFIITPRKKIYMIQTNPLPAIHEDSHVHHALLATGWKPKEFVEHVIGLV